MFVSVDFETRSQVDLRKTGVYPYAVDPSTDIWCMSYSLSDSDAVHTWCPGDSPDAADCTLMRFVEGGGTLRAWNSGFELQIWNEILAPRYGWPATKVEQWVDTAAEAAAMALPRGLGAAAKALGMEQEKDDKGYRLMMKMAKPRAVGAWWLYGPDGNRYGPFATQNEAHNYRKNNRWRPNACRLEQDDDTVVWWDDSESLSRLIEYCEQDVRAEKDIAKMLRDLSYAERQVFLLTQEMNDVGVPVDVELVNAAKHILEFALEEANREMRDLTDDQVLSVTKVNALREWVNENGLEIDNLRKDTVRDLLNGDLPGGKVRDALQLRQDAGKTSTAKLDAFLRCTGDDARARGLLMYHGASTGRWAGRLIQPQNFPRPEIKDVEELIPLVKAHDYEALLATGHPVPVIVSSLLRSMFCAPAGRTFMCADYSQVEARVLAWIAGQDDLVELFAEGGKVYETMGAFIFGLEVDEVGKDSFERQIGKNSILGCFAADTLVLTNRGYVRITDVSPEHRLWDGVQWVTHDGPVYQGKQEVEELWGVQLTPDHLVLTGKNWQPALNLVRHANIRCRGLVTGWASLPWSGMWKGAVEASRNWLSAATADVVRTFSTRPLVPAAVTAAPSVQRTTHGNGTGVTPTSFLTTRTAPDSSTALHPSCNGATTPGASRTNIMVGGGSTAGGPPTPQGGGSFFGTSSLSTGGTVPNWRSIASTTMQATLRGIFASLRGVRTPGTSGRSRTSKPVYDILNAGSRNRFTILTDRGPLIVHNCGFQMGPDRFAEQVREQTGIVLDRGDEEKGEPDVAAKAINGYRTRYPKIPAFWRAIEHAAISAVKEPKRVFAVGAPENKIKFQYVGKYLWCELPSGRMLCYAKPELREKTLPKPYEHVTKECLTFLGVDGMTRQWRRHSTYGGHLTENVVQAIARDLIAGGMYRLRLAGYTPILTVHDEVLVEVDEGSGNFDQFMRLTTKLPVWAGGLPLAGEGWQGDRYQK